MAIVEATAAFSASRSGRGRYLEAAMIDGLKKAQARGVSDPDLLRAAMLAERDAAKQQLKDQDARAAAGVSQTGQE